jgi:tRNA(fMet)-specific endonuclease VapC
MLDSDTFSFIVKGRQPVVDRLLSKDPDQICISVVTEAEQRYGMEDMIPGSRLHRAMSDFLERVLILPWDSAAAQHFAPIKKHLSDTNQQIGDLDTMIAAHAVAAGAILVTNNVRHFSRIPGQLRIENWMND